VRELKEQQKPANVDRIDRKAYELEVELITRLFGGGAVARTVDSISWLRSSSAKSAIRAWWRAGNAHQFDTREDMRATEQKLFGASGQLNDRGEVTHGPGIARINVAPKKIAALNYDEPQHSPLNGAYFPATGMGRSVAELGAPGEPTRVRVTLCIEPQKYFTFLPAHEAAVLEGLRLWLTLGGAGSRTRRGAGALATTKSTAEKIDLPVSEEALRAFLVKHCARKSVDPELDGVFGLARTRSVLIGAPKPSAEAAQLSLLSAMREARQERPHPDRWQGRDGWGQSSWPEADAIRIKAKNEAPSGGWTHRPKPGNAGKYPRIALGLPIVMHYKRTDTEPKDYKIYGAIGQGQEWLKLERYASPILLRPIRVWRNQEPIYVPVAIFTDCTLPADARPLVTKEDKKSVDIQNVVDRYAILQHANETLSRVEAKFLKEGFKKL
jgi:CRISPR-associated protein Cmr1